MKTIFYDMDFREIKRERDVDPTALEVQTEVRVGETYFPVWRKSLVISHATPYFEVVLNTRRPYELVSPPVISSKVSRSFTEGHEHPAEGSNTPQEGEALRNDPEASEKALAALLPRISNVVDHCKEVLGDYKKFNRHVSPPDLSRMEGRISLAKHILFLLGEE